MGLPCAAGTYVLVLVPRLTAPYYHQISSISARSHHRCRPYAARSISMGGPRGRVETPKFTLYNFCRQLTSTQDVASGMVHRRFSSLPTRATPLCGQRLLHQKPRQNTWQPRRGQHHQIFLDPSAGSHSARLPWRQHPANGGRSANSRGRRWRLSSMPYGQSRRWTTPSAPSLVDRLFLLDPRGGGDTHVCRQLGGTGGGRGRDPRVGRLCLFTVGVEKNDSKETAEQAEK